jgi:hypothetical protein
LEDFGRREHLSGDIQPTVWASLSFFTFGEVTYLVMVTHLLTNQSETLPCVKLLELPYPYDVKLLTFIL